MLERLFRIRERGTSLRTEIVAGATTFMTMAYIIFVNPTVLRALGLPFEATVAGTCIGAAIPTLAMGLFTNYPFALAAGMGMNSAVVSFALSRGVSWQLAMGVVVLEGLLIFLLVLVGLREAVMRAIPMNLKRAIGVGIGLLIALVGMQSAGWIIHPEKGPILTYGSLRNVETLIATAGVAITAVLMAWRIRGALLLGIFCTTAIAFLFGKAKLPTNVVSLPDFSTFGKADILGALSPAFAAAVFSFLIVDFFDTMGTVIGVGEQAGFVKPDGTMPNLRRVLLIDSLAASWGALCGASSTTTYIESAAGVGEGGRTGFTSVVVGCLFLAALFFTPIVGMVPSVATAPVLILVGFLLMSLVKEISFDEFEEAFPAFLIIIVMPLTLSISHGIGYGFIAYTLIKLLRGKAREIHPIMAGIAIVFAATFALQA
jgi:AGZA family xanthine/uracil permease-like MFS transporter